MGTRHARALGTKGRTNEDCLEQCEAAFLREAVPENAIDVRRPRVQSEGKKQGHDLLEIADDGPTHEPRASLSPLLKANTGTG